MSDKKRETDDIIYEKKPLSQSEALDMVLSGMKTADAKVAEAMAEEGRFDVEFCVVNDKIWYSHSKSEIPPHRLADAIIAAVREWPVEQTGYEPRQVSVTEMPLPGTHRPYAKGISTVTYDQYVCFDWLSKKILTSVSPEGGSTFLSVMAYIVEKIQGAGHARGDN